MVRPGHNNTKKVNKINRNICIFKVMENLFLILFNFNVFFFIWNVQSNDCKVNGVVKQGFTKIEGEFARSACH